MSFTVHLTALGADQVGWSTYAALGAVHPIDFGVCPPGEVVGIVMAGERRFRSVWPKGGPAVVITHR